MAERDLVVRFIGDDRSLQQAFNRTERRTQAFDTRTQRLGGGLNRVFAAAGVALGAQAGVDALQAIVSAGSDLNEQLSRTRVVLGESADEMIKWSETTATSMGISQRAALAAAGTFAGLFQTVGVGQREAGELSRELVKLAADLASLGNTSPEEALIALRSGLAGEAEPLRRFNIFLTEARVQQEALAQTGKKTTSALTQQEKTLARYNLILRDSVIAQGNFRDTSGELANQQRILAAQVDNLSTQLAQILIPTLTALVGGLNDAFAAAGDVKNVLEDLAALPGIEIPVKIVSNVTEGRGADVLRHIVLGGISPLALGITIGKEIADGIRQGVDASIGTGVQPGVGGSQRAASRGQRAREQETVGAASAGQAAIDRVTRQAAAAQASLNRQLADSEKRAAHLRDLIREDPDNEKLQRRLRAELDKQASLRRQIADEARRAAEADKAAADEAKRKADEEKRAADEAARRRRENQIAARQGRQFEALGLTATGEQRVPGVGALRRRLGTLREQVEGTFLDTPKTERQLNAIAKVLSGKFGAVGREVRDAILQMFADIAGALEGGGRKLEGPLTKTSGLVTRKIAEGLGLTPEQERELRARLSHFNTGGRAPAGGQGRTTGGGFVGGATFVIDNEVTVVIDGQKITSTVTKQQQKARRRNPRQKRGPHRAGTGGH